eukprot:TRINITY_DN66882_c4_g2_i1.p1 TRINITY_DN66882_c4_g2~~TRINITY_DN66882_c4_g2_i1.p1  ORF type:complete len:350 (-),score=70.77 TRINITY_DN66882_c4_g2_i1:378-1427(-)
MPTTASEKRKKGLLRDLQERMKQLQAAVEKKEREQQEKAREQQKRALDQQIKAREEQLKQIQATKEAKERKIKVEKMRKLSKNIQQTREELHLTLDNKKQEVGKQIERRQKLIDKRRAAAKEGKYCLYFCKKGFCDYYKPDDPKSDTCPKAHDPTKVRLCNPYAKNGHCDNREDCKLQHLHPGDAPTGDKQAEDAIVERMRDLLPHCIRFAQENCLARLCPFPHAKHGEDTPLCRDWLNGYCPEGVNCPHIHAPRKALKEKEVKNKKRAPIRDAAHDDNPPPKKKKEDPGDDADDDADDDDDNDDDNDNDHENENGNGKKKENEDNSHVKTSDDSFGNLIIRHVSEDQE